MAVPVARVHLAMAHAALPALLPTPPKWKMMMMMPLLTPPPRAAILPKPAGRADSIERWDAHKKPANAAGASSDQRSSMISRAAFLSAAHKKPLTPPPPHAKTSRCVADDGEYSSTGSNDDKEMDTAQSQLRRVLHAGPGFVAAPDPSLLAMPSFFIRAA